LPCSSAWRSHPGSRWHGKRATRGSGHGQAAGWTRSSWHGDKVQSRSPVDRDGGRGGRSRRASASAAVAPGAVSSTDPVRRRMRAARRDPRPQPASTTSVGGDGKLVESHGCHSHLVHNCPQGFPHGEMQVEGTVTRNLGARPARAVSPRVIRWRRGSGGSSVRTGSDAIGGGRSRGRDLGACA
jgi:hypothetical protein